MLKKLDMQSPPFSRLSERSPRSPTVSRRSPGSLGGSAYISPRATVSPPQSPARSPVMSPRGSLVTSSPNFSPRDLQASPSIRSPEAFTRMSPGLWDRLQPVSGARMTTYLILSPGSTASDSTTDLNVRESHPVLFQLRDIETSISEVIVVYRSELNHDELEDGLLNLGRVYATPMQVRDDIMNGSLDDMLVEPLSMMYRRQQGLQAEANFRDVVRAAGGSIPDNVRRNAADLLDRKRKLGTDDSSSLYMTIVTLPK